MAPGFLRLVRDVRCPSLSGARVHAGRRPARCRKRSGALVSNVEEALRLRSQHCRPDPDAQQPAVSRGRRNGAIVQLAEPGRAMGADRGSPDPLSRPEVSLQRISVSRGEAAAGRHVAAGECVSQHEGEQNVRRASSPPEGDKSFGRASGWGMFAMPLTELSAAPYASR